MRSSQKAHNVPMSLINVSQVSPWVSPQGSCLSLSPRSVLPPSERQPLVVSSCLCWCHPCLFSLYPKIIFGYSCVRVLVEENEHSWSVLMAPLQIPSSDCTASLLVYVLCVWRVIASAWKFSFTVRSFCYVHALPCSSNYAWAAKIT